MSLYTTRVDDRVLDYLADDYNFEITLRRVGDLTQQASIRLVKSHQLRCMKLLARLFTVVALNRHLDRPTWEPVVIKYECKGKPYAINNTGNVIHFNNSSSNRHLAVVIGNARVGVDLSHAQQNIDRKTFLQDFASIFTEAERSLIAASPDPYFAFNHWWTLKEAYAKYTGTGLFGTLTDYEFHVDSPLDPSLHCAREGNITWLRVGAKPLANCILLVLEPGEAGDLPVIVSIVGAFDPVAWFRIDVLSVLEE